MPIILVIIGVIAALGLGGYFWESSQIDVSVPTLTPVATEVTPAPTSIPTPTPAPTTEPATTTNTTPTPVPPTQAPKTPAVVPSPVTQKTTYKDGTYKVTVNYTAPDRESHPVNVAITLKNDVVTASDVTYAATVSGPTEHYESSFAAAYKTQVVGKSLDSIYLSRVGGASLTTNAWNNAQAQIEAQAKA